MEKRIIFLSPAKINLFLRIIGKRSDGYHIIKTIFQILNFGDKIIFSTTKNNNDIIINFRNLVIDKKKNLIFKAIKIIKKSFNVKKGIKIKILKKIPVGSGLGGGSSNAACTLLAINYLWDLNLSKKFLKEIGLSLGADVPVFLEHCNCLGTGIGEKLKPIFLKKRWYTIINPNIKIRTSKIFRNFKYKKNNYSFFKESSNDLEGIICKIYPKLKKILYLLRKIGPAQITGTGSNIFLRAKSKKEAKFFLKKRPLNTSGFIAQGI